MTALLFANEVRATVEWPPKAEQIRVLLKMRDVLGVSEDDWTLKEMCLVLQEFGPAWAHLDPSQLAVKMRRLRKDKLVPKIRDPLSLQARFWKLIRDFRTNQERRGISQHSDNYTAHIESTEWKELASEHRKRCEYRCQFCDQLSNRLEVHHTKLGYRNLGQEKPWHLFALCHECHEIADFVRSGRAYSESTDIVDVDNEP